MKNHKSFSRVAKMNQSLEKSMNIINYIDGSKEIFLKHIIILRVAKKIFEMEELLLTSLKVWFFVK